MEKRTVAQKEKKKKNHTLKSELPYDSAIPFLGINLKELKTVSQLFAHPCS